MAMAMLFFAFAHKIAKCIAPQSGYGLIAMLFFFLVFGYLRAAIVKRCKVSYPHCETSASNKIRCFWYALFIFGIVLACVL